ncbi:MAG TPA: hypothetical protein VG893_03075 [Terracidiphilus sp.]|nr:hypothetical protein [Terracidiphilus sp.]
MLRITINETPDSAKRLVLEGRLAGVWAQELDRVWTEAAPRLTSGKLTIDLHDVTYADSNGKSVLAKIFARSNAEFHAGSLFTNDLAEEIMRKVKKV